MDNSLFFLINLVFTLYGLVLMLRITLAWLGADYYNPLWQLTAKFTDKPLWLLQRIIPLRYRYKFDIPAAILLLVTEIMKLGLFVVLDDGSMVIAKWTIFIAAMAVWIIADIIREWINLYCYIIIIFFILSWVRSPQFNPLGYILLRLLDPLLRPIRRIVPLIVNIDFAPIILFALLQLIKLQLVVPIIERTLQWLFGWPGGST